MLEELKILFSSIGVEHLEIYSVVRAVTSALVTKPGENQNFALVDLGAESTKIVVIPEWNGFVLFGIAVRMPYDRIGFECGFFYSGSRKG